MQEDIAMEVTEVAKATILKVTYAADSSYHPLPMATDEFFKKTNQISAIYFLTT